MWNGTLFNLDLTNTPYRDAIRYDSSTYVTVIDDSYTHPAYVQQGLLFDGTD